MAEYTLLNGDSLTVLRSMESATVDLVITSPPYNCRKDYGVYDDMIPWDAYYFWMNKVIQELYRVLVPGGVLAINVPGVVRWQVDHKYANTWSDFDPDYRTHRRGENVAGKGRIEPVGFRIFEMMRQADRHVREPVIWVKGSDGNALTHDYRMGCDSDPFMRAAHEMILLGSKDRWFHRGGTGRRGRDAVPFLDETKDVWFIPPEHKRSHPAIFPVELPRRLIRLFIHAPDAVVLDPFCGIGSSGVAAMECKRRFIGIDLNAEYLKLAESRIQEAIEVQHE